MTRPHLLTILREFGWGEIHCRKFVVVIFGVLSLVGCLSNRGITPQQIHDAIPDKPNAYPDTKNRDMPLEDSWEILFNLPPPRITSSELNESVIPFLTEWNQTQTEEIRELLEQNAELLEFTRQILDKPIVIRESWGILDIMPDPDYLLATTSLIASEAVIAARDSKHELVKDNIDINEHIAQTLQLSKSNGLAYLLANYARTQNKDAIVKSLQDKHMPDRELRHFFLNYANKALNSTSSPLDTIENEMNSMGKIIQTSHVSFDEPFSEDETFFAGICELGYHQGPEECRYYIEYKREQEEFSHLHKDYDQLSPKGRAALQEDFKARRNQLLSEAKSPMLAQVAPAPSLGAWLANDVLNVEWEMLTLAVLLLEAENPVDAGSLRGQFLDPYTGSPFIFESDRNSFTIRSHGPDLDFDGGYARYELTKNDGDIIVRVRATMDTSESKPANSE